MAKTLYTVYQEVIDDIEVQVRQGETRQEIREGVDKVAAEGADYARRTAPVGTPYERDAAPGTFRDSIISKKIPDKDGMPAAQIYSDARRSTDGKPYSQYVEYGSRGYPGAGTFGATQKYIQHQVAE